MTRKKPDAAKPRAQRSITFYPADYAGDVELAACSMAAQGFWMRCLCLAATHGGFVLVGGKAPTLEKLTHATRVKANETQCVPGWIEELVGEGVCDMTGSDHPLGAGVLISRRMMRAAEEHATAVANGKLGGNPMLTDETLDEALSRAQNARVNAAERQRRRRARAKAVTPESRPMSQQSTVTRSVTKGPGHGVDKRDMAADNPSGPTVEDGCHGVNPRLNPHTVPFHTKETLPDRPESRSDAPASPLSGAGASIPRGKGKAAKDRSELERKNAEVTAQLRAAAEAERQTGPPQADLATMIPDPKAPIQ